MLITIIVVYLILVIVSYVLIRQYMDAYGAVVHNLRLHIISIAMCSGIYMAIRRSASTSVGDTNLTMYKNGYNYVAGILVSQGPNAETALARIKEAIEGKVDFNNEAERQYYEGMGDAYRDWVKHAKPSKRLIVVPGGSKL